MRLATFLATTILASCSILSDLAMAQTSTEICASRAVAQRQCASAPIATLAMLLADHGDPAKAFEQLASRLNTRGKAGSKTVGALADFLAQPPKKGIQSASSQSSPRPGAASSHATFTLVCEAEVRFMCAALSQTTSQKQQGTRVMFNLNASQKSDSEEARFELLHVSLLDGKRAKQGTIVPGRFTTDPTKVKFFQFLYECTKVMTSPDCGQFTPQEMRLLIGKDGNNQEVPPKALRVDYDLPISAVMSSSPNQAGAAVEGNTAQSSKEQNKGRLYLTVDSEYVTDSSKPFSTISVVLKGAGGVESSREGSLQSGGAADRSSNSAGPCGTCPQGTSCRWHYTEWECTEPQVTGCPAEKPVPCRRDGDRCCPAGQLCGAHHVIYGECIDPDTICGGNLGLYCHGQCCQNDQSCVWWHRNDPQCQCNDLLARRGGDGTCQCVEKAEKSEDGRCKCGPLSEPYTPDNNDPYVSRDPHNPKQECRCTGQSNPSADGSSCVCPEGASLRTGRNGSYCRCPDGQYMIQSGYKWMCTGNCTGEHQMPDGAGGCKCRNGLTDTDPGPQLKCGCPDSNQEPTLMEGGYFRCKCKRGWWPTGDHNSLPACHQCFDKLEYDPNAKKCRCKHPLQDQDPAPENLQCECPANMEWNESTRKCQCKEGFVQNHPRFGEGCRPCQPGRDPNCCGPNSTWNPNLNPPQCQCNPQTLPNNQGPGCVPCGENTIDRSCCGPGATFEPETNVCRCNRGFEPNPNPPPACRAVPTETPEVPPTNTPEPAGPCPDGQVPNPNPLPNQPVNCVPAPVNDDNPPPPSCDNPCPTSANCCTSKQFCRNGVCDSPAGCQNCTNSQKCQPNNNPPFFYGCVPK